MYSSRLSKKRMVGEWSAIGRVLLFGFKEVNYFPISLSKAFLASCLFGEESIDDEFLLSSFRFCITSEERETFDNIRTRYVAQCWIPVLAELKQYPEFSSPTRLDEFFSAKMPSAKKTARMLQSQPENEAESQCLDYLKKVY